MIPNNISDAIQAARNGELGTIETIKIGDLVVDALVELDDGESLFITRKPVQDGSIRTDMAIDELNPIVMGVILTNPEYSAEELILSAASGTVPATDSWRDKLRQLKKYKNDREILTTQTHEEVYTDTMIQGLYPLYDVGQNDDAWFGSVVLERIQLFGQSENTDIPFAAAKQNVGAL